MQSSIHATTKNGEIVYNFFITNVYDTKLLIPTLLYFLLTQNDKLRGEKKLIYETYLLR